MSTRQKLCRTWLTLPGSCQVGTIDREDQIKSLPCPKCVTLSVYSLSFFKRCVFKFILIHVVLADEIVKQVPVACDFMS